MDNNNRVVERNKKAKHDYHIEDTLEAGIVLTGTEVKSIRQGRVSLKESYAMVDNGEVFIHSMHISPYKQGNRYNVDPLRSRKLLLHKREISKLIGYTTQKGYSLIPLKVYFKRGKIKIDLAIAKGKKTYDKRRDIAKKDAQRRMRRHMSEKYNY
ncbi:MAG: SsrA-binding protein SmpB [Firmicutes bacterium]|nr:SsrA-binding protein SmpB [Bacillota bacterium]MTI69540.1 SsrA-binding protein SmpB [Bacillota bacterium]